MGCSPVNPEQYESRFPDNLAGFWVWCLLPDISIPVLGGRDNTVGVGGPVNRGNELVVLEDICQSSWYSASSSQIYLGKRLGCRPVTTLAVKDLNILGVQTDSDPYGLQVQCSVSGSSV